MFDALHKLAKANNPDYDMCKRCVGSGIMEIGIAAAKEVCTKCHGEGFIKKWSCKKNE